MNESWKRQKDGMILTVVIAAIMMMTLLVVGMLGRYSTRARGGDAAIKSLQAEALAKGAFWKAYMNAGVGTNYTETINGVSYTISYNTSSGTGPSGTSQVDVGVTY